MRYDTEVWKICLITGAMIYFAIHCITGDNGLIEYGKTKKKIKERTAVLEKSVETLTNIKRDVRLLSSASLDLDILEERCRFILNYSAPNEKIIPAKSTKEA